MTRRIRYEQIRRAMVCPAVRCSFLDDDMGAMAMRYAAGFIVGFIAGGFTGIYWLVSFANVLAKVCPQ